MQRSMKERSMMKKLILLPALAISLLAASAISPNVASAQEIQITGPLAGAPAVIGMRQYRQGRFLIEPSFSFTLQDEFVRTLYAGAHLGFYFTDWIGIGAWGGYGVAGISTGLNSGIEDLGVSTQRNELSLPNRSGFGDQVARLTWAAALQLEFIPLRGKLAMFQKLFVDTDFYFFLGVGFFGVEERADASLPSTNGTNPCGMGADGSINCDATQSMRQSRVAIAPTFGAGITMMFNGFVGLNLNWRGSVFAWNTSGFDVAGDGGITRLDGRIDAEDRRVRLNHMFQVGIMIYLPTAPSISGQDE